MGQNLLSLHGCLLYDARRLVGVGAALQLLPHAVLEAFSEFTHATLRLGYLLSQGVHVCDAAVVYPVAAAEGGAAGGREACCRRPRSS